MARKASPYLNKEQRLKVYRRVKKLLLKPDINRGFCKAFEVATYQLGLNHIGKNVEFYSRSKSLARTYPEIYKRKPRKWDSFFYWFSPWRNHAKNAPRIRILNESIKEVGG